MNNDISSNNINLDVVEKQEDKEQLERRLTIDVHDHIIDKALELVDMSKNIPDSVRTNIKSSIKLTINPTEINFTD